ncbi:unnamed protein product [Aureobasidium vineae]|uniref:BTB domain-containing protein n=1 Tax=Aureobasidium vineae TaxID=2773715 RepID=A0A9N8JSC9_9PEZI|nr:unnamed protein product [Aureobasidium vineae]
MDLPQWSSNTWDSGSVFDILEKSFKTIQLKSYDGTTVHVNKALLVFFSKYYRAALTRNFSEANKNIFDVELSGEHLKLFTTWLHSGKIEEPVAPKGVCVCETYVRLYIFAEQTEILALRRKVIGYLASAPLPKYDTVALILANQPESSPLRKHVLRSYINHWTPEGDTEDNYLESVERDTEGVLPGFMYKLLVGVANREEVDPKRCACCHRQCRYHEHESTEEVNENSRLFKDTDEDE